MTYKVFVLSEYLGEDHAQIVIETREGPDAMIAPVSADTLIEGLLGQKVQQLREEGASNMHRPNPSKMK